MKSTLYLGRAMLSLFVALTRRRDLQVDVT
jgi:hypothetical protein